MRLQNAILPSTDAHAAGYQAPMLDLQYGGQQGFDLNLTEWVSNQHYVRKNLICLLVEAPKGFALMKNPEKWVATLKALVELHPLSIDGLAAGLEVEVSEQPIGGAGQKQEDVTNVTEAQSKVVFHWAEKYGMAISKFHRAWITNLIMDPHSKYPNLIAMAGNQQKDMLADMYSATMMFIEPDPTHSSVQKAWLVTNMYPMGTGDNTGRREMSAAGEVPVYDINYTGIAQFGVGVDKFAQELLKGINLAGANPQQRATFVDKIAADVAAIARGYENNAENLGATAIRL
jgi:hypothetical protein